MGDLRTKGRLDEAARPTATDVDPWTDDRPDCDVPYRQAHGWFSGAICFLLYLLLTLAYFGPSHLFGSGEMAGTGTPDQVQQIWFLRWAQFAIWHAHNPFYTPYINHPSGLNLLANTSMLALGSLFSPLTALSGPVVTWNVLIKLAVVISAFSMCIVLRRWTVWWPAAFLGGLLYGFSAYFTVYGSGYLFLVFVPIPPIILLLLHEAMVRQRWRADRVGLCLGGAITAQYFISAEVLASTLVMAVIGCTFVAIAERRHTRRRRSYFQKALSYAVILTILLLLAPVLFMLFGTAHIGGVPQLAGGPGDLLGTVIPGTYQAIDPSSTNTVWTQFNTYFYSATLYLGAPLIIVLIAIVACLRRLGIVLFAAAMAATALILSLGSTLYVDRHDTGVPLPFSVLAHLPVFDGIVATRFSLFTNLFAALVLAVGLDRLYARLRISDHGLLRELSAEGRRTLAGALCLLVAVVVAASLWPARAQPSSSSAASSFVTSGAVTTIPQDSVVLAYPYPNTPVHTLQGRSVIFYPFVESIDDIMLGQAVSNLPFKLIGSYGWAPGASDQIPDPTPLKPKSVESFFNTAFYGTGMGAETPRILQDLRMFMREHSVDAVIVLPLGRHPDLVVRALTAAIGPPSSSNKADVWLHVKTRLDKLRT